MVQQVPSVHIYPLRVVTQRLATTPTKRLPHIVPFLANTIAVCHELFDYAESSDLGKDGSEVGIVVHKLKTQLSTLLQDKSVEARWSAVVLIKATIEAGGWGVLHSCGAWTRGLLAILNKPDPPTTKKLCLITLTRIFVLTHEHQSLVREITTPAIPPFVTSCLNLITIAPSAQEAREVDVTNPLLDTVLQVLIKLVPSHPSSLRPFVAQTRSIITSLLAPAPSDIDAEERSKAVRGHASGPTVVLAQHLFALLPQCAPKNTSNEEYSKYLRAILDQIHRTSDYVFRAIYEDRISSTRSSIVSAGVSSYGDIVSDEIEDVLNLPGWKGIEAGCERLKGLLTVLQATIAVESSSGYTLPIGSILSTLERLLSVILPPKADQQKPGSQARWNPEVSRDEREGMWLHLPSLHIVAIAVLSTLIDRLDVVSIGILPGLLDQVLWVFRHEKDRQDLKESVYRFVSQIFGIIGPSLSKSTISSLSPLIRTLCKDLLPEEVSIENSSKFNTNGGKMSASNMSNADSYLKSDNMNTRRLVVRSNLQEVAAILLSTILSHVPASLFSVPIRNLIDRTAILTNNQRAMFASVLNPESLAKGKQTSSILPFFARAASTAMELEAVLRPRMPILHQREVHQGIVDVEEEENIDLTMTYDNHPFDQRETVLATENVGEDEQAPEITQDYLRLARKAQDVSMEQTERTSTNIQENLSSESRKRKGDDTDSPSLGQPSASVLGVPSSKHARLEDENLVEESLSQAYTKPFVPIYSERPERTDSATIESLVIPEVSDIVRHGNELANDSDDSFEIPPIILDSDSDDDEEESGDDDLMKVGQTSQGQDEE
ncbi:hypothetical protein MMC11_008303 [Xylographa trunciseda]|nr:hypothetical protein [Xylographa trunciseda]